MIHLLLAAVLASNASGKPLVRSSPGTMVTSPSQRFTNYVATSGSFCNSNNLNDTGWGLFQATCVNNVAADPDGKVTMDQVVSTSAAGVVYQSVTTPSSATFSASAWAQTVGADAASLVGYCPSGTLAACSCTVSTGTCTSVLSTRFCTAYVTSQATPVRLVATFTCPSATTGPGIQVHGGVYGTSTGSANFGGLQLKIGAPTLRYIPTS
jgi:hypothetical protein